MHFFQIHLNDGIFFIQLKIIVLFFAFGKCVKVMGFFPQQSHNDTISVNICMHASMFKKGCKGDFTLLMTLLCDNR